MSAAQDWTWSGEMDIPTPGILDQPQRVQLDGPNGGRMLAVRSVDGTVNVTYLSPDDLPPEDHADRGQVTT